MNTNEINERFKKSLSKDQNTLRCIITGKTRQTNSEYLEEKAKIAGSKDEFRAHYICREALSLLKEGKTVIEVRQQLGTTLDLLPSDDQTIKRALEING